MKKLRSRVLAAILTVCMVMTMLPTVSYAADASGFTDVNSTSWYAGDVSYVVGKDYFKGTGDTTFSPEDTMTRAMFVTVLARVAAVTVDNSAKAFDDVAANSWYAGAVKWASENSIVTGEGNNKFNPDGAITREQMCAIMSRFVKYYGDKTSKTYAATGSTAAFPDADQISSYAAAAVTECRSYNLVSGDQNGAFNPQDNSTRAEVAAVIHRLDTLLASGTAKPVTPVTPGGGGSGGGGGGSSSGGNSDTTATATDLKTAQDLIDAAQKNATNVTASVAADAALTVNDDVSITNNSVTTLTLNMASSSLGNVTINALSAKTITLNSDMDSNTAKASFTSLTINAPNATVTNHVTVTGTVNIIAVSHNTYVSEAAANNVVMSGAGTFENKYTPAPPVTVATAESVTAKGILSSISIVQDGAKLSVEPKFPTADTPTIVKTANAVATPVSITSTAADVALDVQNEMPLTLSGTIDNVKASGDKADITLAGATIKQLDAAPETTVAGSGMIEKAVASKQADSTLEVNAPVGEVNVPAGAQNPTIKSNQTIPAVTAAAPVKLEANVDKLEAEPNTKIDIAADKQVTNIEAKGDLELTGSGMAGSVDMTASGTVTSSETSVGAINNTSAGEVKASGDAVKNITVAKKAAKPTTVRFEQSETVNGSGAITGVQTSMEYKQNDEEWQEITTDADISVTTGYTYFVRVKAVPGEALASDAVSDTIITPVGVTAATITGDAVVGKNLTAAANADATGTVSYQWQTVSTESPNTATDIAGAMSRNFKVTDDQVGMKIQVVIKNYAGVADSADKKTSVTTAPVTADKTSLENLIAKVAEHKLGVVQKEDPADQVALGIVFVTQANNTALDAAKDVADAECTKYLKTAGVASAVSALQNAINTYNSAKKTGTNNEVDKLRGELTTLVGVANTLKTDVESDTDAVNVLPGAKWATEEALSAYNTVYNDADSKKNNENPAILSKAITDLTAAMTAFQSAIRKGAELDYTALNAAITAAETNAASVVKAQDSNTVVPSQQWVQATAMDQYTKEDSGAIQKAKKAVSSSQKQIEINNAVSALATATTNFNKGKRFGTMDIVPPVVAVIEVTRTSDTAADIKFKSNEEGSYTYQVDAVATPGSGNLTKDNKEAVINLTNLTAGVRTLILTVKDEKQNATEVSITIPAYVLATKVSFDANGGSNPPDDMDLASGTVTLPDGKSMTAPDGKVFQVWNTRKDGKGTNYKSGASVTLTGTDVILYAQWFHPDEIISAGISDVNELLVEDKQYAHLSNLDGKHNVDVTVYTRNVQVSDVYLDIIQTLVDTLNSANGVASISTGDGQGAKMITLGGADITLQDIHDFVAASDLKGAGGVAISGTDIIGTLVGQKLSATVKTVTDAEFMYTVNFVYPDMNIDQANEIIKEGTDAVNLKISKYASLSALEETTSPLGGNITVAMTNGSIKVTQVYSDIIQTLTDTLIVHSDVFLGLTVGDGEGVKYYPMPQGAAEGGLGLDLENLVKACGLHDSQHNPVSGGTSISELDKQSVTVTVRGVDNENIARGKDYTYKLTFKLQQDTIPEYVEKHIGDINAELMNDTDPYANLEIEGRLGEDAGAINVNITDGNVKSVSVATAVKAAIKLVSDYPGITGYAIQSVDGNKSTVFSPKADLSTGVPTEVATAVCSALGLDATDMAKGTLASFLTALGENSHSVKVVAYNDMAPTGNSHNTVYTFTFTFVDNTQPSAEE